MIYITGILADVGGGKTNLLTAMGKDEYDRFGTTIVANYHLKFPYIYKTFREIANQAITEGESRLRNCLFLIDEMSEGADSYEFLLEEPKKLSRLGSQIRKIQSRMIYTDQRYNKVAKRIRDQTGGWILMRDLDADDVQNHPPIKRNCAGQFECDFYTPEFEFTNSATFDGKPYRDLYDSEEIIIGSHGSEPVKTVRGPRSDRTEPVRAGNAPVNMSEFTKLLSKPLDGMTGKV